MAVSPDGKCRWLIAASAVGIHLCIGSVYAWSVFAKPVISQCGWGLKDVQLTFSIAILFLGLSAAFLGHFVEKHGPRKSGTLAATLFGLGVAGSGVAIQVKSLLLLYACYGVLGGTGLGLGYIAPVSTLVKWFPDRRGLATGLAIMGFGFAALISSPIIQHLIVSIGLASTFFALGTVYFLIMFLSSQYLAPPQPGWVPKGYSTGVAADGRKVREDLAQLTANEAVRTRRFYWLWSMLFINVTCGIAVISVASPMGQEVAGMTPAQAAVLVSLIGLVNGVGRIGWAALSDWIGRPNTYTAFFVIQILAFSLLPKVTDAILFQAILLVVMTCYGGGFACIPAFLGDLFGTKQLGAIHGYTLTAWAAAGLAGPIFAAWVRETTGSYAGTLTLFTGLFVVGLVVSLLVRLDIRTMVRAAASRARAMQEGAPGEAERSFAAKLEEVGKVQDFVTGLARGAGLDAGRVQRVQLATEETVANICSYAYREESSINRCSYAYDDTGAFTVRVQDTADWFEVEIADRGAAFNPLLVTPPDPTVPLAELDLKGLGVLLIRKMTDEVRYRRLDGRNILTLIVHKAANGPRPVDQPVS